MNLEKNLTQETEKSAQKLHEINFSDLDPCLGFQNLKRK